MDPAVLLSVVWRQWDHLGSDPDRSDEIYLDDAVLEFPQSGERFEGLASFAT